jgi:hypothetical protein
VVPDTGGETGMQLVEVFTCGEDIESEDVSEHEAICSNTIRQKTVIQEVKSVLDMLMNLRNAP